MAVFSNDEITFKDAFCHYFNCPPEAFERDALRHCLYPHARAWMSRIERLSPRFFDTDYLIIRALGETTSLNEVRAEASYLHDNYARHRLRRDWLLLRISGKAMLQLGSRFLKGDYRDARFYRISQASSTRMEGSNPVSQRNTQ